MLSVISIGICNYNYATNLSAIPCAYKDCEKIYRAFSYIMENEFSEQNSICLKDITAHSFRSLLNSLPYMFTNTSDTLVMYFSGHGKNIQTYGSNSDLVLCFSDYHDDPLDGEVSVLHHIIPALNKAKCNVVLILDSCFSGSVLSNATEKAAPHHISILTSTTDRKTSSYSIEGSEYTRALYDSIIELKIQNVDFTLSKLQDSIKSKYSFSRKFVPPGESGDVVLKRSIPYETAYFDFDKRFLNQINGSDAKFREAIWYSLCDVPSKLTEKIFHSYFHAINSDSPFPPEANWLVRRAIGSAVSCIENGISRKKLIERLLRSPLWQEQCIGIIGARYDIANDSAMFKRVTDAVKSSALKRIDVVWLINLYAAENEKYDFTVFLNSCLANQPWGIQEIWKAASKNKVVFSDFIQYVDLNNPVNMEWLAIYQGNKKETESELYNELSKENERGRLPMNSKSKYILSLLYGTWRGHKLVNLKTYLGSIRKAKVNQELEEASQYSKEEYKMAIFDFFTSEHTLLTEYQQSLQWGLSDPHPWVRQSAIQAFKSAGILHSECNQSIIDYMNSGIEHIGEFDLILEYSDESDPTNTEIINTAIKLGRYSELEIESLRAGLFSCYK